jgi:3'-5' exoribonuclease
VKSTRSGSTFLSLKLTDASGGIEAVMWDVTRPVIDSFAAHDIVRVLGKVNSSDYGTQIKIDDIKPVSAEDDYQLEHLLPSSPRDLQEMEAEFDAIRKSITNADLTALLDIIFATDINYRAFCEAPAAKGVHHNYIHGLLEHTIAVCKISDKLSELYPEVNHDLLVAGAILHDIGKTLEFDYTTAIDYSDRGRLFGHIVLGERIISRAIREMDSFPTELELQLIHLVLAHHGEQEYGSPQPPQTLEAFLLHHADNIDAKANIFAKKRASNDEDWSEFDRVLSRFLYLKRAED